MASGFSQELEPDKIQENQDFQRDEVLALESIFEDTGRLSILSTLDDSDHLYRLQVQVKVETHEDGIRIDAWVSDTRDHAATNNEQPLKPQFFRSESGRRLRTSIHLHHLSPLILSITMPHGYPSETSPQFTLSCLWLDAHELSQLCTQLDTLWSEEQGMPIVYTWIDWLQSNSLSFLKKTDSVLVVPYFEADNEGRDPRALPECTDIRQDLMKIIRYDLDQDRVRFHQESHTCVICFDQKTGNDFFLLDDCLHSFCKECMQGYCEMHVKDGTVTQISCPNSECGYGVPPQVIRAVLGEELYTRWERLVFQKALDTMADIEWCPRCNFAVIKEQEEELSLGHCTNCMYSFCTRCMDAWHAGTACEAIDLLEDGEEEDGADKTKVKPEMPRSEIERRKRLRKQMERLSRTCIKDTTKKCPTCRVPIEKAYGCNKVHCINCNKSMCWLCGRAVTDYTHFHTGKCSLFTMEIVQAVRPPPRELPEGARQVRDAENEDPRAARDRIFACPRCKQRNLREGRNNHLKCWSCKCNFCIQCKTCIQGVITLHFAANMPCKQHS